MQTDDADAPPQKGDVDLLRPMLLEEDCSAEVNTLFSSYLFFLDL